MDSNGLRFWMLSQSQDWLPPGGSPDLQYCAASQRLHLRSLSTFSVPVEDFAIAKLKLDIAPWAKDRFGTYARWDSGSGHVVAGGAGVGETAVFAPPANKDVTDLVLGYDGILYIAVDATLILVDRRGRWPASTLSDPAVSFWRLAAHPAGGVVALDRKGSQIVRVTGQPLQVAPDVPAAPGILRSCEANHDPPRVTAVAPIPAGEFLTGIAEDGAGKFAVLSWGKNAADNSTVSLRVFEQFEKIGAPMAVSGIHFPYGVAWLPEGRIALLATGTKEAFVYDLDEQGRALPPSGETYILADRNAGPFAHVFDAPPYYQSASELVPLLPLSMNSLASQGTAQAQKPIDSGGARSTWHRLFVEALIPPGCGVTVWLAAAERIEELPKWGDKDKWFAHLLGDAPVPAYPPECPSAVWLREASEVPFHPGLLGGQSEPLRRGLFMVLIQRAGLAVRNLQGRYLAVRMDLNGNHRRTPEVAAVRAYASRFSYVNQYLPELYREDTFGPAADVPGPSTRADFFGRFVSIVETQLTRAEDRVASAHLLTRAQSTPDSSIDWLGTWLGVDPEIEAAPRRRERVARTPQLYRERGTVEGVTTALDIATDGMCTRGAVIVLEDYRLRHTFATILGADLSIQNDPLLPGSWASSNSFVGDTLFLGDEHRKEFLSLFANVVPTGSEQAAIDEFFDRLAHRMTVFVHDEVEAVDGKLIERVVNREKPAHVMATVRRASQSFLIGIASLLGVNTYLAPAPPKGVVRVEQSRIGRSDLITHVPSLDPRYENGSEDIAAAGSPQGSAFGSPQPLARISGPKAVLLGNKVSLDASASFVPAGRKIVTYRWSLIAQ